MQPGRTLFDKIWDSHTVTGSAGRRACCCTSTGILFLIWVPTSHSTGCAPAVGRCAVHGSTSAFRTTPSRPHRIETMSRMRTHNRSFRHCAAMREPPACCCSMWPMFGKASCTSSVPKRDCCSPDAPRWPETVTPAPPVDWVLSDLESAPAKWNTYWQRKTLRTRRPKRMRVAFSGQIGDQVFAKDLILYLIGKVGAAGGTGYAVEYTGSAIRNSDIEARLTICNMSIEFGARVGMVAPDDKTLEYIANREFAPKERLWDEAAAQLGHAALRQRCSVRCRSGHRRIHGEPSSDLGERARRMSFP